jgi:hypothetical protein
MWELQECQSRKARKEFIMEEQKITKAMNDGVARGNAVSALGLDKLAQVSNTEYAVSVKDAEGNDKVVVIKLTVPKTQRPIDEMVEAYEAEKVEKAEKAELKKAEREAKKASKAKAKKEEADTDEVEF